MHFSTFARKRTKTQQEGFGLPIIANCRETRKRETADSLENAASFLIARGVDTPGNQECLWRDRGHQSEAV
jgi:hypothetical protein